MEVLTPEEDQVGVEKQANPTFAIRFSKLLLFVPYLFVAINIKWLSPKTVCSADFFNDSLEFTGLAAYPPSNCEGRANHPPLVPPIKGGKIYVLSSRRRNLK